MTNYELRTIIVSKKRYYKLRAYLSKFENEVIETFSIFANKNWAS